jgi:hypothetical protein
LTKNDVRKSVVHYPLFILLMATSLSYAQKAKVVDPLKGIVIDNSSKKAVPFVNIFNESQRQWSISQEKGTFSIDARPGDTLAITCIGYLGKKLVISEEDLKNEISVLLAPRQYIIDEVQVVSYKKYEDFQKAFLNLKLPETKAELARKNLQESCERYAKDVEYNKNAEYKLQNPGIGFAIGKSGNKEKELLSKLKKKDEIQYLIDKKYNRELVYRLTDLEGDELTNFIGFCNFSMEYLEKATEYEIVEKIMQRYKAYKILKDSTGLYDLDKENKEELNLA